MVLKFVCVIFVFRSVPPSRIYRRLLADLDVPRSFCSGAYTFILRDHDSLDEATAALSKKNWIVVDLQDQPTFRCSRCGIHQQGTKCPHSITVAEHILEERQGSASFDSDNFVNNIVTVTSRDVGEDVKLYHIADLKLFICFNHETNSLYHIRKPDERSNNLFMACDCSSAKYSCSHVKLVKEWVSEEPDLKQMYQLRRIKRTPEYVRGFLVHKPIDLQESFKDMDLPENWSRCLELETLTPKECGQKCEHGITYETFTEQAEGRLFTPYKTWRTVKVQKAWAYKCTHGCFIWYTGEEDKILNLDNLYLFSYKFLFDLLILYTSADLSYHGCAKWINMTNFLSNSRQLIPRHVIARAMNRFLA